MLALYHNDMSLCAQKVRVCLAEKGSGLGRPSHHVASAAIISFGIAFRHRYLEKGELGRQILDQIPNVFKRQRHADVIAKGPDSEHFVVTVQRMIQLLEEMEEALQQHEWLAGSSYSLADVAFTPYLARLEHLNIPQMVGHRARVANWYDRCKARPSFETAIRKWENPDYLALMKRHGIEHWPQLQKIIQALTAAAA